MANTKISALPASTTPLAGTEVLPIVQSSNTKQVSVANLTAGRAVATGALTVTGAATVSTTLGVTGATTLSAALTYGGITLSNAVTGTGKMVLDTSPTLVTPVLGVATGTSFQGIIGNVTPAAGAFTTVDASGAVTLSGGTANGVTYLNGSKVLTSGSALVFDGATLGVGVTPSSWSLLTGLQVKNASLAAYLNRAYVIANAYYNGGFKYIATDFSSNYTQSEGIHSWFTAPSGTAGNAVTFTEVMATNVNGGLRTLNTIGVGNATPSTSGAGITFPATQSASSDANTLDDYEEGTWTPVVSDAATAGNLATLSDAEGVYTKIGNVVYWRFNVVLSSKASMTAGNDLFIQGFPFQSAAISGSWYNPCPTIIRNITFTGYVQFNQVGSTTRGTFRENVSNANGSDILVSDLTDSAGMQASGFYRVA